MFGFSATCNTKTRRVTNVLGLSQANANVKLWGNNKTSNASSPEQNLQMIIFFPA